MFGLTLEKLVVIAPLAGLVMGPHRLAQSTRLLADTVRALRRFVEATRARTADEVGVPVTRADWDALDLRRYDPRRIVREALDEPDVIVEASEDVEPDAGRRPGRVLPAAPAGAATPPVDGLDRIRPRQRYLVVGDSAHPRRIRIADLPEDDPRRIAAETPVADETVETVPATERATAA